MYFGLAKLRGGGVKGRIESLDVPHLEHDVAPPGERPPVRRPRPAWRRAAFRPADGRRPRGNPGRCVVQAGGGGDHRGVELIQQAGVVGQGFGVALGGHPLAIGRQRIDDGHQLDVVALGEFLGVEPAQSSRADDGHSQLVHGVRSQCQWSVQVLRGRSHPMAQLHTELTTDSDSSHAAFRRSRPRPCRPSCWP